MTVRIMQDKKRQTVRSQWTMQLSAWSVHAGSHACTLSKNKRTSVLVVCWIIRIIASTSTYKALAAAIRKIKSKCTFQVSYPSQRQERGVLIIQEHAHDRPLHAWPPGTLEPPWIPHQETTWKSVASNASPCAVIPYYCLLLQVTNHVPLV